MSSKSIPKCLTEDQIKYWLANTDLSKDELIAWYASFYEHACKNAKLDKENFSKFFTKLHHKKNDAETFYKLAFNGKTLFI